ncbi:MAG: signal peptidase II, partial [Spirochaetes bacterium]|nr:signal peptidase II [Spirochaetota bacterium]
KIPKSIKKQKFESAIISKLNQQDQNFMKSLYQLDEKKSQYLIKKDLNGYEKARLDSLLKEVDFRTLKWILLVLLQGLGTIIVLIFFFTVDDIKQLLPLALILSGAFGNVIDRIIRGFVVDYVLWFYKDFYWPVFNLADVYTVVGAFLLIFVLFIFPEKHETMNKTNKQVDQSAE